MATPRTDPRPDTGGAAPTAAKARVIDAAQVLFARQGVGGTSLQMIADELGVTKAAIYHQYPTKEEIIRAAAEAELARLEVVIARAEAEATPQAGRDALLTGIIDLAVERRRTIGTFLNDPVIGRYFVHDRHFRQIMERFHHLLVGDDHRPEARIRVAMLVAAVSGSVSHPFVVDLDDRVLRDELTRLAGRFVSAPF